MEVHSDNQFQKSVVVTWNLDTSVIRQLTLIISQNNLNIILFVGNDTNIQDLVTGETTLIITDYNFWYNNNPIENLDWLRMKSEAPVIALTSTVNKNIMTAVFSNYRVLFIRNSSSENTLVETMKKYCSGKLLSSPGN
ncbi:MAG: hypothetical protein ABI772_10635 [Bacteroidota bacterium]